MWRTYSRGFAFRFHSSSGDYQYLRTATQEKEFPEKQLRLANYTKIWVKGKVEKIKFVEDLGISIDSIVGQEMGHGVLTFRGSIVSLTPNLDTLLCARQKVHLIF